jgi:uncharacterized protein (TIGR00297 family)
MTVTPALEAALVATSLTAAVAALGLVTIQGALAGASLAYVFTLYGGWPALLAFALLVVLGTLATRLGYAQKAALGVAQAASGRRGARHALANAGPAAAILLLGEGSPALVACIASLAAALTDTVSSETGLLSPETPRLLLVGPRARRGADGAMTLVGTLSGVALAFLIGLGAQRVLHSESALLPIFTGAVAGNLLDSVLGAGVEARLPRNLANEIVNAVAALAGGVTAYVLASAG